MTNYDFLYNKEYYGSLLTAEHRVDRDLRWSVIPNGTVLPHQDLNGSIGGGLLNERGEFIIGSGLHRGLDFGYKIAGEAVAEREEDVVFLGLWPDVWGHCLTDNIRRLWVLRSEEFMNRYGHLRFLYLPMYNRPLGQNFRKLLEILGAGEVRLEPVNQITRFRTIILPDECFCTKDDGTRLFTREYQALIDRIRDYGEAHFEPMDDRKLYFTYRNYSAMRTIGERKLEQYFSKMGYRIVSPEQYTFAEQLNMLLNCVAFASTIGSASHNIIFLRDGTNAHLIPRMWFIPEYQLALDQVHDLNITYVDSSLSLCAAPNSPWNGPFYYIISRQLQECFGHSCRSRAHSIDFGVYRDLSRAMNGEVRPAEYYCHAWREYMAADPQQTSKETLLVKLCRNYRVRKLIAGLLG